MTLRCGTTTLVIATWLRLRTFTSTRRRCRGTSRVDLVMMACSLLRASVALRFVVAICMLISCKVVPASWPIS